MHARINRQVLYHQYSYMYQRLVAMGYHAVFGQNTFSLMNDQGVSSYLYSRMFDCIPYKGFGVSAQSMSRQGISYNILKNSSSEKMPEWDSLTEEDVYLLPPEEIAAKYVCIALYSGRFSLSVLTEILGRNAEEYYADELGFLSARDLICHQGSVLFLTKEGFSVYGAVAALFWSKKHQEMYLKVQHRAS